ncbi:transcriptional regulator, ArsR family protein [Oceanobacter sp. RED65]|uniref:Transcriptional regulator, ArsR family protein n=2 Tax=Bermanella marisrubri TaxID=207949 RepID=Q1MYH8_9GAMM|nr:transcriptional regulator, ArsR family protein [Oceanobacter sp. RED65] [Bermanella marisrubri]
MLAVKEALASQQDHKLDQLAGLNKAAADGLRLKVLQLLKENSFGVLELADIFSISQSRLSHHLKILASAGLVTTRREGNSIFYRRALSDAQKDGFENIRQTLFDCIDKQTLSGKDRQAVEQIYTERARQSRSFFERHAGQFTEVQDLIAGYEQYADSLDEIIQTLGLESRSTVMEVGPGQGGFLKPLSQRYERVIALDNSPAMLDLAKQQTDSKQQNIDFLLGDPEWAVSQNISVDFLAFNMVMHHIPSPKDILQQCSQLLTDEGYLLITDLCPHDQDWVKSSCGDLWLGLDPQDLKQWAKSAGLSHKQQIILGMRNGFQVQIQVFQLTNPILHTQD